MALAGKAEIIADYTERFIRELQKMFSLFQLAPQNKCADCETELFLKICGKIGAAETYMLRNLSGSDGTIDMLQDIMDCPLQCFIGSLWNQLFSYFLSKCQQHLEIQILDSGRIF